MHFGGNTFHRAHPISAMLYETIDLYYLYHANYDVWCNVKQFTKEKPFEGKRTQLRDSYKQARHWDMLRNNRLIVPLEEFESFWDKSVCVC